MSKWKGLKRKRYQNGTQVEDCVRLNGIRYYYEAQVLGHENKSVKIYCIRLNAPRSDRFVFRGEEQPTKLAQDVIALIEKQENDRLSK